MDQEFDAGFPELALFCICCQAGCPEAAEGLEQVAAVVFFPFAEYQDAELGASLFEILISLSAISCSLSIPTYDVQYICTL